MAGLVRRHAAFLLLFLFQFEVGPQFALQIRIAFSRSATISFQFSSTAGHITRATASDICFHCDSSTTSCFLPFSVSR